MVKNLMKNGIDRYFLLQMHWNVKHWRSAKHFIIRTIERDRENERERKRMNTFRQDCMNESKTNIVQTNISWLRSSRSIDRWADEMWKRRKSETISFDQSAASFLTTPLISLSLLLSSFHHSISVNDDIINTDAMLRPFQSVTSTQSWTFFVCYSFVFFFSSSFNSFSLLRRAQYAAEQIVEFDCCSTTQTQTVHIERRLCALHGERLLDGHSRFGLWSNGFPSRGISFVFSSTKFLHIHLSL